jgi:hypothetical protein
MPFAIASCRLVLDLEVSVERRGGFGFGWIFIPAQPEYARRPARGGATAGARTAGTSRRSAVDDRNCSGGYGPTLCSESCGRGAASAPTINKPLPLA